MGTAAASATWIVMSPDKPILEELASSVGDDLKKLKKRLKQAKRGDSEGVHDARTASRRLREDLLVMGRTAFDSRRTTRLGDELHTHEKALAKPRDSDVMLEMVDDYAKRHRRDRKGLEPLRERLEARRKKTVKKACRRLSGSKSTLRDIRKLLRGKGAVRIDASKDATTACPVLVRHFTHGVVWRQYDSVLAYDVLLEDDPDVLHHFRSECRRLRYGLELLGESVPRADVIVREMREIQDRIGEMHDHHVCAELVTKWIEDGKLPANPAMTRFIAYQRRARDRMRDALTPCLGRVLAPTFRTHLEHALDDGPKRSTNTSRSAVGVCFDG